MGEMEGWKDAVSQRGCRSADPGMIAIILGTSLESCASGRAARIQTAGDAKSWAARFSDIQTRSMDRPWPSRDNTLGCIPGAADRSGGGLVADASSVNGWTEGCVACVRSSERLAIALSFALNGSKQQARCLNKAKQEALCSSLFSLPVRITPAFQRPRILELTHM